MAKCQRMSNQQGIQQFARSRRFWYFNTNIHRYQKCFVNEIALAVAFLAGAPASRNANFVAYRSTNEGSFFVEFPVEKVFPLYGPAEEAKWAPGWEPHWLYPEKSTAQSRAPELGWVFETEPNTPQKRLWYVDEVDLTHHEISYLVYLPDKMIYRIRVMAAPSENPESKRKGTLTSVTYQFVGLSDQGNAEIKKRTHFPEKYAAEMREWATHIEGYLRKANK
jgi:hypothetical protein